MTLTARNCSRVPAVIAGAATGLFLATTAWADKISVFDWSGYEDEGFFGAYMKEHGKAPNFSYFADEDEALNKILAGYSTDVGPSLPWHAFEVD